MNWHYAINGETRGPVGDEEFQRLVQQGVITRETLIWRDGMANWVAYDPDSVSVGPRPAVAIQDGVACAMCGTVVSKNDAFILSGISYCAACKPQVLQRLQEGLGVAGTKAEEMRKNHIKHEASVKSIGVLYFIGGAIVFLAGMFTLVGSLAAKSRPESIGVAVLLIGLSVAQIWVGIGVRRLRPWARICAGILSGIGLLGFPVGTIINGYILYLVFSEKGKTVFSPEYQEVIRPTPHIKYKTSIVVWIVLGILVLVIVGGITAAILSK